MKKLILICALLLGCAPSFQMPSPDQWQIDAWFHHDHLNTKAQTFTQDFDLQEYEATVRMTLSLADYQYIDSVANAVNFWNLPDTIDNGRDELLPLSPGKTSFFLKTPLHRKTVTVLTFRDSLAYKLIPLDRALDKIVRHQPSYKTLPPPPARL